MSPLPTNPATHGYLFTDDMRFVQKAVITHPTDTKRFLILKRHHEDRVRPGTWDLPGGSVLFGELHGVSLRREIAEETGLSVKDFRPVYVNTKCESGPEMYFLWIAYVCRAVSVDVVLSNEHSDFKWTTKDEFIALDPLYKYLPERPLNIYEDNFLRDIVTLAF